MLIYAFPTQSAKFLLINTLTFSSFCIYHPLEHSNIKQTSSSIEITIMNYFQIHLQTKYKRNWEKICPFNIHSNIPLFDNLWHFHIEHCGISGKRRRWRGGRDETYLDELSSLSRFHSLCRKSWFLWKWKLDDID